mgnify:CR=1 FL=1
MFKPIPVAIGLRYLRAKRRNGFISCISVASSLGSALGVTVLITTLAVMSGFQKEIRSRLLQMTAHTTISRDGEPMPDWMRVVDVANKDPRVAGAAPYIEIQSMISGPRVQGAIIQGIDPALEPKVSVIDKKITKGSYESLKPGSFNVLLGKELAMWPGVDVGDQVLVTFADGQGTPAGHAHRLVGVRPLHLGLQVDLSDSPVAVGLFGFDDLLFRKIVFRCQGNARPSRSAG